MDSVPRISRAQKLDALSSMANIGGYRAVIEAAHEFGRFFTGSITAAGKVPPAKVFVIGAGVAGLAAIGAASGLGAIVRANDTRPEVADQIKSLGGEFVPVDYEEEGSGVGGYAKVMSEGFQKAQREVFAKQAKDVDIIITTALIPGKPAPKLITEDMVKSMKQGSVIVDMAAEQGGNCELHGAGRGRRQARRHHHRLQGPAEPPREAGVDAVRDEPLPPDGGHDQDEEHRRRCRQRRHGRTRSCAARPSSTRARSPGRRRRRSCPPRRPRLPPSRSPPRPSRRATATAAAARWPGRRRPSCSASARSLFLLVGRFAPASFLGHFTVFVLACFVGYMVVWNVTPALHTPLMSVTNAVSSIIAIGALVQIAPDLTKISADLSRPNEWIRWLAVGGIGLATINMFGGFAVTQRMLEMFRK